MREESPKDEEAARKRLSAVTPKSPLGGGKNGRGAVARRLQALRDSGPGSGTYEVDYGTNIASCAFLTTQGEADIGSAGGAITGNTDRSGNAEATFTTMRDATGALIDTAFQQIVIC